MKIHPYHLAPTSQRRAFTLMEMILVLSIIALLIGIGVVTFTDVGDKSGIVAARAQINTITNGVELYKITNRTLPPNIDALVKPPATVSVKTPFMEASGIIDPWDRKYIYKSPGKDGKRFQIYSLGPDGKDGTDDDVTKDS